MLGLGLGIGLGLGLTRRTLTLTLTLAPTLSRTQAVHGGLWRSPYKLGTIGIPCAMIYFGGLLAPYLAALSALTGLSYLYLTLA